MKKSIQPSVISGTIDAPASKSMAQRALAAALLANGTTRLYKLSSNNDSDAATEIIERLGAVVSQEEDYLQITSNGIISPNEVNCGEAGLSVRMFTPISSLANGTVTLNGEGSLRNRPVDMVEVPLKQLGVEVTTQNGYLPIQVKGPLKGGDCYVDGSVSSQFLTGLLMALPLATKDSTLFVTDLKSKPYIDMTLALLADFGIRITHDDYQKFSIQGNQKYKAQSYQIEGDWSGAAFLLVAGAIAGQVTVTNLSAYSTQADKAILQALQMAGAYLSIEANQVTVTHKPLSAFVFDATHCPDLFPPLVALAAHCKGTSVITGAKRLLHKESNRALSLSQEFGKMGIKIEVYGDQMQITGGEIQSADVHSHNDHRIAMACATATLFGSATVTIDAAEAINKSYPTFFDDLATISSK